MEQISGKSLASRESVTELFTEQKVDHENRPGFSPIHSHAAFSNGKYRDNEFSGIRNDNGDFLSKEERAAERGANDIGNANRRKMDSYVVTPNGSLLKYNYKENTITSISNYMPYDPTDGTSLTDNKNNAFYELNPTTVSDDLRMLRKVFYHNPNNP